MANCELCGKEIGFIGTKSILLPGIDEGSEFKIKVCAKCDTKIFDFCMIPKNIEEMEQRKTALLDTMNENTSDEVKAGIIRLVQSRETIIKEMLEKEEQRKVAEELEKEKAEKTEAEKAERIQKLREEREQKEKIKADFLLTTGYNFEGYNIVQYLNIVHGEVVLGTGFFSELSGSISDLFGTSSGALEGKLSKAKAIAQERLIENSINVGANALIGVDFDVTTLENNVMVVSVNGTAVKIQKVEK